jgi:hypothetical protein
MTRGAGAKRNSKALSRKILGYVGIFLEKRLK